MNGQKKSTLLYQIFFKDKELGKLISSLYEKSIINYLQSKINNTTGQLLNNITLPLADNKNLFDY